VEVPLFSVEKKQLIKTVVSKKKEAVKRLLKMLFDRR